MYSFMNLFLSVSSRLSSMTRALALRSKSAKLLLLSSSTSICDLMMDISLLRCYKLTCSLSICSFAYFRYSSTFDYDSFAFLAKSPSCLFTSLRSASLSSSSPQRSLSLVRRSEFQLRRLMIQLYMIIIVSLFANNHRVRKRKPFRGGSCTRGSNGEPRLGCQSRWNVRPGS